MLVDRPKSIVSQVNTILLERIRQRIYAPGSRLPSESELAQEFGVSRATIRTVLATLASEGLILRKQGDGTYVNAHIEDVHTRLGGMWDFTRLIDNSGRAASIRLQSQGVRSPTVQEAAALTLDPTVKVLALIRLFSADAQPVIVAKNAIPLNLFHCPLEQCDAELPLHEFLYQYCRQEIAYGIFDLEATAVDDMLANTLACSIGTPLLKLTQTFYNSDNQPLVFGISYYNDKALKLRLVQTWN